MSMRYRIYRIFTVLLSVAGAALWIVISIVRDSYLSAIIGIAVFGMCYYDLPYLVPRKANIHTVLLGAILLTIASSVAAMGDGDVLEGRNLIWVVVSQVALWSAFPIFYDLKHPGAIRRFVSKWRSG